VIAAPEALVLPVDKPEGPTSHDVVAAARRALGVKRVGHTGTLDPFASGLLLLCVGRATRLAEYFSGLDKSYEAVARLGVGTDTLDREGTIVEETDAWREVTRDQLDRVLEGFRGEIDQVPPAYSAKKVSGERAYQKAREGRAVDLDPCRVTVRALDVTSWDPPHLGFRVTCSSGTYVRSLARDIGNELGVAAHLTGLRRTAIGDWRVEDALLVAQMDDPACVADRGVSPLEALRHLPTLEVDDEIAGRLQVGQAVPLRELTEHDDATALVPVPEGEDPSAHPIAVAHAGGLLAVGESDHGVLRPKKVFSG
jgi:tRNA pseudouridine55 synthase